MQSAVSDAGDAGGEMTAKETFTLRELDEAREKALRGEVLDEHERELVRAYRAALRGCTPNVGTQRDFMEAVESGRYVYWPGGRGFR